MASLGPPNPSSPATARSPSTYSGFHLPSSDTESDADEAPLPFPTALARADFLAADFHPAAYLSSLFPSDADTTSAHRHQTLEDLRGELRERSAAISAELLELVNANYTSFLGLGDELRGGEDRVEDVRVALLGFRRAVDDIQARVRSRRTEVAGVCRELGATRDEIERGRRMLELDERVGLLEGRLAVGSLPGGGGDFGFGIEESDEEEVDDLDDGAVAVDFVGSGPNKLMALAKDYVFIQRLADSVGPELPFVKKMDERMTRCRNTILLDLSTAIKEALKAGVQGQGRVLKFMDTYRVLGAEAEAVRVLREK